MNEKRLPIFERMSVRINDAVADNATEDSAQEMLGDLECRVMAVVEAIRNDDMNGVNRHKQHLEGQIGVSGRPLKDLCQVCKALAALEGE